MPHYAYRAVNANGRQVRGSLAATNEIDLQSALFEIGLELVDCRAARAKRGLLALRDRITAPDLIQLCVHLEQMQRAGIPLLQCLADLRDSAGSPRLRDLTAEIYRDVSDGQLLSTAFAAHPQVFGAVFTALTAAGEATGNLAESFRYLVRHLKWTDAMAAKVRKATRYPAVVAFVVLSVTTFLMAGVVPQVVEFLTASNQTLPIWTTVLIATSAIVQECWPIILGLPIVAAIAIRIMKRRSEDVAHRVDAMVLRLPLIGPVVRKIALARFAQMFAVMFQSGIDVLTCLESSRRVLGNRALAEALALVRQQVQAGSTLSAAMAASGEFPSRVTRMVKVGEDTGNLAQTLQEVAVLYDQEVDRAIDRLIGMVEPMLTVALGLIMAWIALAVFWPIYDSLDQIGI